MVLSKISNPKGLQEAIQSFFYVIPSAASRIYNMPGSSVALFLCLQDKPFIAVEQTEEAAARLYKDIIFFKSITGDNRQVFFLPEPNGPETSGERADVAYRIRGGDSVVTSANGLASPVWSHEGLNKDSLYFETGKEIERDSLELKLKNLGYKKVSIVVESGEYSAKGWLIDIFPSSTDTPLRIEFFGDEVESIKFFEIESQRSVKKLDKFVLLPATEPLTDCKITSATDARLFLIDPSKGQSYGDTTVFLSRFDFKGEGLDAGVLSMRGIGIYPDERKSLHDISRVLRPLTQDTFIIIVSSSEGQAERVKDILFDDGVIAPIMESGEVINYKGAVAIVRGNLSSGFFIPGLIVLTERELFGERPSYRPLKKSKVSRLLLTIDDLAPGDYVVHKDHGIGKFISIQKQRTGDTESELIVLEYTGGDRLYIPLYYIDRIKKYRAEEGVLPSIDRLGGKTWQRRKEKVRKAVKEMAERLLNLYAEREVSRGFAFSPDTEMHKEFYDFFPYEETPDQIKAIKDIESDMESERPMDRLVCGDVGYGKTEVAMRAAFKAVYDNKQAAVLVPTTILCEQHYLTFKSRFSAFPVRIDYLSRFKPKREQDLTVRNLGKGEIDIIIGTHGLLRKDISFSNMGLLVIDEEHRFGVAQKERMKELSKGVDILSMTATPIPRTLQMALSGIRPMSLIETPPEERLAVRSIVSVFNDDLIKEAIEREVRRNGQVLFVHNFIFDIQKMADLLIRLLPDKRIAVVHGQMPGRKIEDIMLRFVRREIDVLLSTNIIGSGIDIPTANTIIINRADKMGLADLYQLRGRVGRSNVRAYAYFLIPGEDIISEEAKKRLQALKDMSFLGAGFMLAMKDMEIRGAGNLLGHQQSGHIHAVGFDMYVEMLERAVAELKGIEIAEEAETTVSLAVSAFIPEGYIEDITIRLSIYRRIANARNADDLKDIESEMADRFGPLPEEVKRLLDIMKLKIKAKKLLITNITESDDRIRFAFSKDTSVVPEKILALQKNFTGIRFQKDGFEISLKGLKSSGALPFAQDVLKELL